MLWLWCGVDQTGMGYCSENLTLPVSYSSLSGAPFTFIIVWHAFIYKPVKLAVGVNVPNFTVASNTVVTPFASFVDVVTK